MKTELRIALRYLLSRKSHGAVNVISAVAMAGVAVAAAAMIIVLSVFNGFAELIDSKISSFNPPYLLCRTDGAVIANADSLAATLSSGSSSQATDWRAFPVIDEQAFALGGSGTQMPVNFRAIPSEAIYYSGISSVLVDGSLPSANSQANITGKLALNRGISPDSAAILSIGVAMQLNLRPGDSIQIYLPRRTGRINPGAPHRFFRSVKLPIAAVYQLEQENQDRDLLLLPLPIARNLLSYSTEATSIAFYPDETSSRPSFAPSIPAGESNASYQLLDRRGQEAESFRMIAVEKWITFLMLTFIMLIASFNIISTLSLMMVEKQGNMAVLRAMGATPGFIRNIFANQAWIITIGGGLLGLLLGSLLILGQQHYGWVPLVTSNPNVLTTNSYPVLLTLPDLLISVAALLLMAGLLTLLSRRLPEVQKCSPTQ